jgi:hypothetical protein
MDPIKLRVGRPITPEQFDELSDEQLIRLVPKAYRDFFPGKDFRCHPIAHRCRRLT